MSNSQIEVPRLYVEDFVDTMYRASVEYEKVTDINPELKLYVDSEVFNILASDEKIDLLRQDLKEQHTYSAVIRHKSSRNELINKFAEELNVEIVESKEFKVLGVPVWTKTTVKGHEIRLSQFFKAISTRK